MAKEAFYFSHDFGARNDPKLQKVLMKLGQEGKGVYWDLVEMLFEEGGKLLLSECDGYAFALRTNESCITRLINEFGLFQQDGDFFWSDSVNRRINDRNEKSEKARQSVLKRWENTNVSKNNTNVLRSEYDGYTIKERKGKERKEELNSSVVVPQVPFEDRCLKFVDYFNLKKDSKYQATDKVRVAFKKAIKNYSADDLSIVIQNALKDPHHKESNFQYITPEFILRPEIIERYKNIKPLLLQVSQR